MWVCSDMCHYYLLSLSLSSLQLQTEEKSVLSGPLTHYLCFSVFPLLTEYAAMLPQLLAHLHVIINLLMCCSRLGGTCQLTTRQLAKITAFIIAALKQVVFV